MLNSSHLNTPMGSKAGLYQKNPLEACSLHDNNYCLSVRYPVLSKV